MLILNRVLVKFVSVIVSVKSELFIEEKDYKKQVY